VSGVAPRCGRPMLGYEAVWGALLDEVTCGRPEGHNGPHRSVQALRKALEGERRTWAAKSAARRERARQARRRAVLAEALRGFDCDGWRHAA